MIIDIGAHYTTAPKQPETWSNAQVRMQTDGILDNIKAPHA